MRGRRRCHPIETPVRPTPLKIGTTTATYGSCCCLWSAWDTVQSRHVCTGSPSQSIGEAHVFIGIEVLGYISQLGCWRTGRFCRSQG